VVGNGARRTLTGVGAPDGPCDIDRMNRHSVASIQLGGEIVGWAVLSDVPGEERPRVSQLFRTEAEAEAERDRLIALEAQEAKSR
jgi:hypothetical protein